MSDTPIIRKKPSIGFTENSVSEVTRSITRWVFELLRNIAVVGVLRYLGNVGDSSLLKWVSYLGAFLLVSQMVSYVEQLSFDIFPNMKRRWLATVLELVLVVILLFVGLQALNIGINVTIENIARAYAAKPS